MGTKINHVLLTGVPGMFKIWFKYFINTRFLGIGKTTIVKKISDILRERNVPIVGFYTTETKDNKNNRIGFNVVTLDGKTGKLARIRFWLQYTTFSFKYIIHFIPVIL